MNKLSAYKNCFVCGQENPVGLKSRFETDGEKVWTEFEAISDYEGYKGIIHGGIITALLDETMDKACRIMTGAVTVTAKLEIRFRREARVGMKLLIEGRATGRNDRYYEAVGTVRNEAGELLAEATGMFAPVSADKARQIQGKSE